MITLDTAADPTRASNKEDLATLEQVKAELPNSNFDTNSTYLSSLTPEKKENKPPPQKKKSKQITATSPLRGQELSLENGDGSKSSIGYALIGPYKGYQFSPQKITLRLRSLLHRIMLL